MFTQIGKGKSAFTPANEYLMMNVKSDKKGKRDSGGVVVQNRKPAACNSGKLSRLWSSFFACL
jgi:hypothetical protein